MSDGVNRRSLASGKLGVTPAKKKELLARGLLALGGLVKSGPVDHAQVSRDQAAFVRALLGR